MTTTTTPNAVTVPVDAITVIEGHNPRQDFDQADMRQLTDSIRVHGVLQPILMTAHPDATGRWLLIAGERRLRAARDAGLTEIPVFVNVEVADDARAQLAAIENLIRSDLSLLEEARAIQRAHQAGMTHRAIAEAFSISPVRVRDRLHLLELPEPVAQAFCRGDLPLGALALIRVVCKANRELGVTLTNVLLRAPSCLGELAGNPWHPLTVACDETPGVLAVRRGYGGTDTWTAHSVGEVASVVVDDANLTEQLEEIRRLNEWHRLEIPADTLDAARSYGCCSSCPAPTTRWRSPTARGSPTTCRA